DRPGVFHPADFVDLMNVEVVEQSAAGPQETVKSLNLPGKLIAVFRLPSGKAGAHWAVHAVSPHRAQIADLSIADSLVQLLASAAVADHEADGNLQILFIRLLCQIEHPLGC